MKQQIMILGMSCEEGRKNVENALFDVEGISGITVSLNPPQATLDIWHVVSFEQLNTALARAGDYQLCLRKWAGSETSN